jgi:hypothetical protein
LGTGYAPLSTEVAHSYLLTSFSELLLTNFFAKQTFFFYLSLFGVAVLSILGFLVSMGGIFPTT